MAEENMLHECVYFRVYTVCDKEYWQLCGKLINFFFQLIIFHSNAFLNVNVT